MFNLEDKTYNRVPAFMPLDTALVILERIYQHLEFNNGNKINIILHGGEPTLWPLSFFQTFFERVSKLSHSNIKFDISLQTNGYKLDLPLLDLLAEHNVAVGISLDGPPSYHDAYRLNHKNQGSYDRIIENIYSTINQGYGHLISGFLSVAQPQIPPAQFLNWSKQLPIKRLDVLWPIQYNYNNLPWANQKYDEYIRNPLYGTWFAQLFKAWWQEDNPDIYIRHFFDIIKRMMGIKQHTDALGNDFLSMFVVNTDGGIEYPDYFRSYTDGGSRTLFNIFDHNLEILKEDPLFSYCLNLYEHLPAECWDCTHRHLCGGGFLPGRMKHSELIPTRKSVLCHDQFYFFSKVSDLVLPYIKT